MCIVQRNDPDGAARFGCAQAGCVACQDSLVREHERLVHYVLRRYVRSKVSYDELLQAGRIGLWRAVLGYDAQRGVAFSTYAVVAIRRAMWAASRRKQGGEPQPQWERREAIDAQVEAEEQVWWGEVYSALAEAVGRLPERTRQVIIGVYGLDGQPERTMAAVGREWGISREGVRYWRDKALVQLRLAPIGGRLHQVYGRAGRAAYVRTQKLSREWRRRRRQGR